MDERIDELDAAKAEIEALKRAVGAYLDAYALEAYRNADEMPSVEPMREAMTAAGWLPAWCEPAEEV